MQQRLQLLALAGFALFWGWTPAQAQSSGTHTVCGVNIGSSTRCYRELRQLEQGCAQQPVICGHALKRRGLAPFSTLKRRCVRMWRRRDKKWVRSLCGVALYSRPKTFCGSKGIEVALACSKQALQKAGIDLAALPRPRPQPRQADPAPVARPVVGALAPRAAVRPAPSKPTAPTPAKTAQAKVGSTTVSWGGPVFWLFFLQFLTLGLVFVLFRGLQERRQRSLDPTDGLDWDHTTWSPESQWGNFDSRLGVPGQSSLSDEFEDVLDPKMKQWGQRLESKIDTLRKTPLDDLEAQGHEIFDYYLHLAEGMVQHVAPNNGTPTQNRLLEVQKKIEWIFSAHREPHGPVALVADLRHSLQSTAQELLNEMGYLDVSDVIEQRLRRGTFTFDEFLERKRSDQVKAFINKEPLQNFGEVCREYLQRLDMLYQSNLDDIRELLNAPSSLPEEEQQMMYQLRFVEQFLMKDLPQRLEALSRQSSPAHVGALLDRLAQFVEDCLVEEGLELYPRPEEEELESHVHARIRFVRYAGVRDTDDHVLRAPRFPSTPPGEVPSALEEKELVTAGAARHEQPGVSDSRIRAAAMISGNTLPRGVAREEDMDSYPSLDAANDFRSSPPRPAGDAHGSTREYGKGENPEDS